MYRSDDGIYPSDSLAKEILMQDTGNKGEGERSVFTYMTDPESRRIAEESQADVGLKRYFRPILRCSRSEYRSTPSLEAPCLGAKISVSNSPATSTHGFLEQRSAI